MMGKSQACPTSLVSVWDTISLNSAPVFPGGALNPRDSQFAAALAAMG